MARSSRAVTLAFALLVTILAIVASPNLSVPLDPVEVAPGRFLSPDFYKETCPQLEGIVRRAVQAAFSRDSSIAPGLLRIQYHDCITQGCDASLLLEGKNSEQAVGVNDHLHAGALQFIEKVRTEAQRQCGPIVSCADITALGAREAVVATGGPAYAVNLGQLDSLAPASPDEWFDLPGSWDTNYTLLLASYSRWKLSGVNLVALAGAHTIGSSKCLGFYDRFHQWDNAFNRQIGEECERDPNRKQSLDVLTPRRFDNQYYVGLLNGQGVLTSDRALVQDRRSLPIVEVFARDQHKFFEAFSEAIFILGSARKHRGGEVRNISCSVPNSSRLPGARAVLDDFGEGHASSA